MQDLPFKVFVIFCLCISALFGTLWVKHVWGAPASDGDIYSQKQEPRRCYQIIRYIEDQKELGNRFFIDLQGQDNINQALRRVENIGAPIELTDWTADYLLIVLTGPPKHFAVTLYRQHCMIGYKEFTSFGSAAMIIRAIFPDKFQSIGENYEWPSY